MRIIREEGYRDDAAIRVVHRAAFRQEDEGKLVDRLRSEGLLVVSLVAEEGGLVVGHAAFSDLRVDTQKGRIAAVALAPVGVVPEYQRCGIGSELIRQGMQLCRERFRSLALVVGDPKYYSRFGFSSELARAFQCKYSKLGDAWMAAELVEGCARELVGLVKYPAVFEELEG
jgi:putative acetyltransferase